VIDVLDVVFVGCTVKPSFVGVPAPPGANVRWKFVVPPSPRKEETMKKYEVLAAAANDTFDCAIPEPALWLHVTCVPVGVPLVTFRIVS
jgi:hypothetical protein